MTLYDYGARRLERCLGSDPVGVYVNGTRIPWDEHTPITIRRAARSGEGAGATSTAQVTLVGHPEVKRGDWLTIYLSPAAVTALGGTDADHRYRFAGRVTDATLTYRKDAPTTLTVIAAGVLPSFRGDYWQADPDPVTLPDPHTNVTVFDEQATRLNGSAGDRYWPPLPGTATTGLHRIAFLPAVDVPRLGEFFPTTGERTVSGIDTLELDAPTVDVLAALADSLPAGLLIERRDGSIWLTVAGYLPGAFNMPAPATSSMPRRQPVNDVTVIYGPDPVPAGSQVHRNIVTSPYMSDDDYADAVNGSHTITVDGLRYTITTGSAVGSSSPGATAGGYDYARDGNLVVNFSIDTPDSIAADQYTITAEYWDAPLGGPNTLIGTSDPLDFDTSLWAGGIRRLTSSYMFQSQTIAPPAGTTMVRLRCTLAAGNAANGSHPITWRSAHLISYGHAAAPPVPTIGSGNTPLTGFDGSRTDTDALTYSWTGGANTSPSVALSVQDQPAARARVTDPATIHTHGLTPLTVHAYLLTATDALALAEALLSGSEYDPPLVDLDALALIEAADDLPMANAVLSLELGDKITVADLPDDVPQDLTVSGSCYVAGLDETITPGSWRVTITPALTPGA